MNFSKNLLIVLILLSCTKKVETTYQLTRVEVGNLENIISTTGTLYPKKTYKIFSKTTGTLFKVNYDYNDYVKKGDVLAEFDRELLRIALKEAQANLIKAEIQYNQAKKNYDDTEYLFSRNLKSKNELDLAYDNFKTAEASYLIAQAGLDKAKLNYEYAIIRAPASGVIIEKNVNEGDIVSSGNQVLFVIATDLSSMQIEALIDENDIGMIKKGYKTRLSILSSPDEVFYGSVNSIKPKATTVQNIVNYSVVIEVTNLPPKILPGMTANIDIIIDSKENVLKVPNSALKFSPPQDIMRKVLEDMRNQMTNQRQNTNREFFVNNDRSNRTNRGMNFIGQQGGAGNFMRNDNTRGRLWYTNEKGELRFVFVNLGISDGQYTEVSGRNITNGMQVITSMRTTSKANIFSLAAPRGSGNQPPNIMFR